MTRRAAVLLALAASCSPLANQPGPGPDDVAPLGFAATQLGGAYRDNLLLRFEDAEAQYRQAAAGAPGLDEAAQAETELYLALNKSNVGEHDLAELIFARARELLDRSGGLVAQARAQVFYAEHRMNMGDPAGARDAAAQALLLVDPARSNAGPPEAAAALAEPTPEVTPALSAALSPAGGLEQTLGLGALTDADRLALLQAQAHYVLAAAARAGAGGDPEAATAAAEDLLRDLPVGTSDWLLAAVTSLEARQAETAGDLAGAAARADRALELTRRYGAGERPEALARLLRGRILFKDGREDAARRDFDAALKILARGGPGVVFDDLAPYLADLAARPASRSRDAQIFLAVQQLRNPVTSETLARLGARLAAGDTPAAQAIRALQDTERETNRLAAQLDRLTAAPQRDVHAIAVSREQLAAAQAAAAAAREAVAENAPTYGQIADRSIELAELQQTLRPEELFVQTRVGGSGGVVVAVSDDDLSIAIVDFTESEAEALVRRIQDSVYADSFDVAAARELYLRLLGPIEDRIEASETLIFAPDGPVLSLPPAIMVSADPVGWTPGSRDHTGVPFLGLRKSTSVTLSPTSFALLRRAPPSAAPQAFRGFGDFQPIGPSAAPAVLARRSAAPSCVNVYQQLATIPPLEGTGREVRLISEIVTGGPDAAITGEAFSDTAIKTSDLAQARVLHFATHGLLPLSSECLPEPSLTTSLGGPESDGLLEASEVVELALDADLVVLSACETGGRGAEGSLGTGFRRGGGEALSGLVRAFFYAGARNVVASHWLVPDAETVELMEGLYLALARGESADTALRGAQGVLASRPETSHPFYWAAFAVNGDASRAAPFEPGPGRI